MVTLNFLVKLVVLPGRPQRSCDAAGDSFPRGLRPAARFGVKMQGRYSSVDKDSG